MSRLIFFMLVSAIYFVVNEACKENEIVIKNNLGYSRILQYHCRSGNQNLGVQHLNANSTKIIKFKDDGTKRSIWKCLFRQGINMKFYSEAEAYLPILNYPTIPKYIQCGQLRVYIARLDALYLRMDEYPALPVHLWRS
ncbi:S-protein homolog 15-like [Arabidopsis lyrata subsp. lyrata]|uniref:S-protein homolog 15-like n=1 Tax=Arabidopsis lyrata subsp. lyrata TaxID=81972 RepID=UPI000A29AE9B|nr:S-protein homolog 15-like [Arabidopsis lyrata subsp. lyrata]|eukprot:XP_020876752.1 S-protein homolog 15-like [Arabidopsis lyrata subsp. lyrata]